MEIVDYIVLFLIICIPMFGNTFRMGATQLGYQSFSKQLIQLCIPICIRRFFFKILVMPTACIEIKFSDMIYNIK